MSHAALFSPRMDPDLSDPRRRYEETLTRAMGHAERFLPDAQAFEVAHDVAIEMLNYPVGQVTGTLIYLRVTSRLRDVRRATERRAALDGAYLEQRTTMMPTWAQPGAELEARELRARIDGVLARMPSAMRETFLLVREEEMSYKEAAARLGVSVGTVHTQLSRASAILRECVQEYHAGAGAGLRARKGRRP